MPKIYLVGKKKHQVESSLYLKGEWRGGYTPQVMLPVPNDTGLSRWSVGRMGVYFTHIFIIV